jgi:cation diffusion facilitator CzcD-associated flavoprotein CzcO
MHVDAETVIIGAGPSGLAVAASLQRRGLAHLVIDRAPAVGWSWRNHYRRLHLHTVKHRSGLPGLPFPDHYPPYPSRAQVVEYLEAYAAHFDLRPALNETVEQATPTASGWQIRTDQRTLVARQLVVASGYNAIPHRPDFPGLETFAGQVVHSADYQDGVPFRGQAVVVVGCGNSGAEIALDLFEHGAAAVTMIVRGPRYVAPRDLYGIPAQTTSLVLGRLPRRLGDALGRFASRLAVGDLTPYGFRRPKAGPLTEVDRHGRVALVDIGTLDLIKQGAIRTAPAVTRIEPAAVVCVDGRSIPADAIVLATGYRAGIHRFLDPATAQLDAKGLPQHHGRHGAALGLFFCGFRNPSGGALRESALEAERIATQIEAAS